MRKISDDRVHHGQGLYKSGGLIVHIFSTETVERLASGYEIVEGEAEG